MLNAALFVPKSKRANKVVTVVPSPRDTYIEESVSSDDEKDLEERSIRVTIHMSEKKKETNKLMGEGYTKGDRLRKETSGDGFICYKDDEDRFSQRYTLKMKTFSHYHVALEIDQDMKLNYVVLGGKKYNRFNVSQNIVNSTTVYGFVWSTSNITITQRKHRSVLPCQLKLKSYKQLQFQLLVKFFSSYETKHLVGYPLSSINLDYRVGCGENNQTLLEDISFEQIK